MKVEGADKHAFGQVFQIDLMDDADAGRHDLEGVEGLHAPFEKLITLAIALKLDLEVAPEGIR